MSRLALIALFAALFSVGCGGPLGRKCRVSGTVTFGGARVADGSIYFVAPDAEVVLGYSKIVAGQYSALVTCGRTRVRITAERVVPGRTNEAGNPLIEQYIPPRFNEATELGATVERSSRLDWELADAG
jgi:hypothetical protein